MSSILLIQSGAAASADLGHTLAGEASLAVIGAVDTLAGARAAIARRVPDLIVADLRLPDGPLVNLLDALRPGRSHVLALTGSLRDPYLMHTLRHGADGCLVTGQPPQAVLAVIRQLLAGESPLAPEVARRLLTHFDTLQVRLAAAERRVLQWTGEGHLPREIARRLEITPQQVGRVTRSVHRRLHADLHARHATPRAA